MRDFDSIEEYKAHKMEKHRQMVMKQNVPYSVKVEMSKSRIRDFIKECEKRNLNYHVSVGGLDSSGNMIEFYKESEDNERAIHEKDIESLKHRLATIQEMGGDSD